MAVSLLLSAALTEVRQYLDAIDEDGTSDGRWSDAEVTRAIKVASDQFLKRYAREGDGRLFEIVTVTASSSGVCDLSSYDPFDIHGVTIFSDPGWYPISRVNAMDRGRAAQNAYSMRIRLLRRFAPGTTAQTILYNASATANTLEFHNQWICAQAAKHLSAKDEDMRQRLDMVVDDLSADVFPPPGIRVEKMPGDNSSRSLAYYFDENTAELGVVYRNRNMPVIGV